MLKIFADYALLLLGFIFTFIVPGLYIIDNFFPKLPSRIKIPLVPILSILISTYLVYFVSIIIGFSRYSILLSFLTFCPWIIYFFFRKKKPGNLNKFVTKNSLQLGLGLLIFLLFLVALFPGIYTRSEDHIVMSSVNWQDTAMHTGIIESIAQGNFPPQAPYYAGVPLNYYYFTDFHSSILVNLFGRFFPRVLVYTNPFFAMIFSFSIFALTYEVSRNKLVSGASSLAGVLFGNMIFINFIKNISSAGDESSFLRKIISLLTNNGYSMEYNGLYQMSPMADYFLQNRPMMIGLSVVVLVTLFVIKGSRKYRFDYILLAGILTGALIKFQYFAVLSGIISFCVGILFLFNIKKIKLLFKAIFAFFAPIVFIPIPFIASTNVNGKSIIDVVKSNSSFGNWERGKDVGWFIKFFVANFNLPFILTIFLFFVLVVKIIKCGKIKRRDRVLFYLFGLFVIFFGIPHVISFTIHKVDMFKFFYFMVTPMVIFSLTMLNRIIKRKIIKTSLIILFVLFTGFTSILTLGNSYLNKSVAYTLSEEKVGLWIRKNTPQKSVFVSVPTVHTPITQIGGRLRVLSYINWPYSHGYNDGEDNVFKRREDVENVYKEKIPNVVKSTIKSYNADYIYYGNEEKRLFPEADSFLDSLNFIYLVYNSDGIKIYEVRKTI